MDTTSSTKKEPSMHISLGEDIRAILKPFAKNRTKSMSEIIRYSLEKLFEEESVDPKREEALKRILARKFVIPGGYKIRSFWITLFTLADRYPDASSKKFWRELVYLSEVDKTHKEIVLEISEELAKEVGGK
jgi:Arc/MetJ-type ribon-helix-helix transcriptional regulator